METHNAREKDGNKHSVVNSSVINKYKYLVQCKMMMELHVPTTLKYLECVRNTNEVRTECTEYLGIRIIIVEFQTFDFTKENEQNNIDT